jgi:hypothetical protein
MKHTKKRRQQIVIIEREPRLSTFEAAMAGPVAFNSTGRIIYLVIMVGIYLFVSSL